MQKSYNKRSGDKKPLSNNAKVSHDWALWETSCIILFALAGVTIIAFAPIVNNGFVDWDDVSNFLFNEHYRGLSWKNIKWAWKTNWLGVYQPLSWMLFEAQYVFFKLDAWGYHLTSLAVHITNTWLFWALVSRIFQLLRPDLKEHHPHQLLIFSGFAAGFFAAHPLCVEAVAWASTQPYLVATSFFLLSVLSYLRAFEKPRSKKLWFLLSVFFALFATLCKTIFIFQPLLLFMIDACVLNRLNIRDLKTQASQKVFWEKTPFFLISLFAALIAMAARNSVSDFAMKAVSHLTLSQHLFYAAFAILSYIKSIFLPISLSGYVPIYPVDFAQSEVLLSFLGIALVLMACWFLRKKIPSLSVAMLAFGLLLFPYLLRTSYLFVSDRYCYVPMCAWCLIIGWWALKIAPTSRQRFVAVLSVGVIVLLGLSLLTRRQCNVWKNTVSLWKHYIYGVSNAPRGARKSLYFATAHLTLAVALEVDKRYQEADIEFEKTIEVSPIKVISIVSRFMASDRLERLLQLTDKAIALESQENMAIIELSGHILLLLGRDSEALKRFSSITSLPNVPESSTGCIANTGIGRVLLRQKKYGKAIRSFNQAIKSNPDCKQAKASLALTFLYAKRTDDALKVLAEATKDHPDYSPLLSAQALIFASLGKYAQSESLIEAHSTASGFEMEPDFTAVGVLTDVIHAGLGDHLTSFLLGSLFARMDYEKGVIREFSPLATAKQPEPRILFPENRVSFILNSLGLAHVRAKKPLQAIQHFWGAFHKSPKNVSALSNIGVLLAGAGAFDKADDVFRIATKLFPDDKVLKDEAANAKKLRGSRPKELTRNK